MTDPDKPTPPPPADEPPPAEGLPQDHPPQDQSLSPEKEYQRLNPGAGGPASQQQERGKRNAYVTRDDGGAGIAGSQNEDVKGHKVRGPRGAST